MEARKKEFLEKVIAESRTDTQVVQIIQLYQLFEILTYFSISWQVSVSHETLASPPGPSVSNYRINTGCPRSLSQIL